MADVAHDTVNVEAPPLWYYEEGGQRRGPVAAAKITQMLMEKTLNRESQVWSAGMNDWAPIASTPLAATVALEPPPLPGGRVSNAWVWWAFLGERRCYGFTGEIPR